MRRFLSCAMILLMASSLLAVEPTTLSLWPSRPPGDTQELPAEQDLWKDTDKLVGGKKIIKLTNVSTPQLTVFAPPPEKQTGTAVIICPGGGHHILAYDHEGTEVAQWLNELGITGIVLKYRVPFRNKEKRWEAAVQDAQRAVRLARANAEAWQIKADRIGILGFSAGGETAGLTAILHDQNQYAAVDEIDRQSARPDFAVLIYPGGLVEKDAHQLRDNIRITSSVPPLFLVHAYDDPVSPLNSLLLATEWKKAQVPVELHLYATGGHGFGMRNTGEPVNEWPQRCATWMKRRGLLEVNR